METHEVDQLIVVNRPQSKSRISKRVALYDEAGVPVDLTLLKEPLPALTSITKFDLSHSHVRSGVATNVLAVAGLEAQYTVVDRPIVVEFGAALAQHSVDGGHVSLRLFDIGANLAIASIGGHAPKVNGWVGLGQSSAELVVPGIYNLRVETVTTTSGTLTVYCEPVNGLGPMFLRGRYSDNELAVA